jgi:hypothetical protein
VQRLVTHMTVPEKQVWLNRSLTRLHHNAMLERWDPPLAFVECDRAADQLTALRCQLRDATGLASPSITGDFEVRFHCMCSDATVRLGSRRCAASCVTPRASPHPPSPATSRCASTACAATQQFERMRDVRVGHGHVREWSLNDGQRSQTFAAYVYM